MAEQSRCKRLVAGSSPACGSNFLSCSSMVEPAAHNGVSACSTHARRTKHESVAEPVDASDLKSLAHGHGGANPSALTNCCGSSTGSEHRVSTSGVAGSSPARCANSSLLAIPPALGASISAATSDAPAHLRDCASTFSTAVPPPRRRGTSAVSCLPARDCAFSSSTEPRLTVRGASLHRKEFRLSMGLSGNATARQLVATSGAGIFSRNRSMTFSAATPSVVKLVSSSVCSSLSSMPHNSMWRSNGVSII